MKRLVEKEISDTAAYQLTEADNQDRAKELSAAALKAHQDALRPKKKLASDVHENWQTNTTPRWCGVQQAPCSPQHGKS